ncbi:septal ring lytic transglycosylase RlpA family protein [Gluconacetobacter diazotrophicus]|uniref:Endolytic peptidoglycan transglycosylase RlpA n=1 Tax=Gluconacetobacter diazotrophicus TaxID=33996 RepID=A0A7W4I5E3_GLUDI|nr:septal ring lytic transglycosylase RlpA family protein [Gluconacetobacter diazotrophicus]MBB2155630.1 septal ring lytic transglycosylase RlpA family protein [Gluconacetobacter diazotrophicus]
MLLADWPSRIGDALKQDRNERRIRSGSQALMALACLFAFASTACGREVTAGAETVPAPASPDISSAVGDDGHPPTAWAASVRAALARRSQHLMHVGRSALSWSEQGVASWYGHLRRVRPTSSGRAFDPRALTAAHPTLPMGTRVLVRSEDTGRSVVVTVNDRGPFLGSRIIDLSPAAAARLGMLNAGTAHVVLQPAPVTEVAQAESTDTSADAIAAAAPGAPRRVAHHAGR